MNGSLKVNPHRSSLGTDANIMALLSYLAAFILSWIPVVKYVAWAAPLVIFLLEKESPFVKFHAMQALLLEAVSWVFAVVFGIIIAATFWNPLTWGTAGVFSALLVIVNIALTVFAIVAIVKAYGYYEYKIPVVGDLAVRFGRGSDIPL